MIYLLDTNICVRFLNGRAPKVREKLLAIENQYIAISTITQAEMAYGVEKSQQSDKSREMQQLFFARYTILPFDTKVALIYGRIRATLEKAGTPIGPYDMQIAAIALALDLTLVTHNTREFGRISSLKIEDWEL